MKTNNNTQPPDMSSTLREFNHLFKESNDIYHTAALKLKLSDSALEILYSIVELGDGCLQRDICEITYLPKQTVHSSIQKLVKDGYLLLVPGKGRSMHIQVTATGQTLLENTIYPLIQSEEAAFSCMTKKEREQLLILEAKHLDSLRKEIEKW